MKIEFVNHASVIYHHKNIHLITDPWIEGTVFQNGWSLLGKTKFSFEDFKNITHIWFSHEHPDHFFPPNIKKIPLEYRKQITILFQRTHDNKVIEYCKKQEFKEVIELQPKEWLTISDDFQVMCTPYGHDSWICIKTDDFSVLNTNDCVIRDNASAKSVKNKVGKVDVLLTQFSYAQYEGNKDEPGKRRQAVQRKYDQMDIQISVLKPTYLIPFASYVWFCHEENIYMNDETNRVGDVYNYYEKSELNVSPIVLSLGDTWNIGVEHDSLTSVDNWNKLYDSISVDNPLVRTKSTDYDTIYNTGLSFIERVRNDKHANKLALKVSPISFYLTDINVGVELSNKGIKRNNNVTEKDCNIQITSEVLNYCLKFDWGFNTTLVNGRLQCISSDSLKYFKKYEAIANTLNHHDEFSLLYEIKKSIKKLIKF